MPDAALPPKSGRVPKSRESNKNKEYSEFRDREYLLEAEVAGMVKGFATVQ
jgi:hypothetical protein